MTTPKNTKLTEQECADLTQIMQLKYAAYLHGREFSISITPQAQEVCVTVTLANLDESFFYPVEGRIDLQDTELSVKDASLLLLDFIDSYFEEFFQEDERVYIPIDWNPYQFDGCTIYARGQVLNRLMERQADQFLGESSDLLL